MKKTTPFLIVALCVSACSSELIEKTDNTRKSDYMDVSIIAEHLSENETKTIREIDKSVSWMPNEKINIICGNDKAMFTSTNTERASVASFSGQLLVSTVIGATEGSDNNSFIWGLYPYDENVESDGTYVTTTLPHAQTGVSGTFADKLFLTLARSQSFNLGFFSVCSGFKFSLTHSNIASISFSGNNNEDIAGKARLTFVEGVPCANILEGEKTITLAPENGVFETGVDYYFVFFPTVFEDGFTVSFTTSQGASGSFIYSQNVSFARNTFVNKSDVDANVTFLGSLEPIVFEDPVVKAICINKWDTNHDGELSYREAEAVSSITPHSYDVSGSTGFAYCQSIESFNEFRFFVNCTSIGYYTEGSGDDREYYGAFEGCTNLKSVILPPSLISIGAFAFKGCNRLSSSLFIPETVSSIGYCAFYGCTSLSVFMKSVTPPTLTKDSHDTEPRTFGSYTTNDGRVVGIRIPQAFLTADCPYKTATYWKNYYYNAYMIGSY